MKEFTRDDLLRCMRKVFLEYERDQHGAYPNLLGLAVRELANQEPEIRAMLTGPLHEVVSRLTLNGGALQQVAPEALWYLISMGYLVPREGHIGGPSFHFLRVTALGREWARGSEPSPEDQQGFLAALKVQVPRLDPVIEQYMREAVAAYGRGLQFAAAVMLGAASEKAIYLLAKALHDWLSDGSKKTKLDKEIQRRSLFGMIAMLSQILAQEIADDRIPFQVHEGAIPHLNSLTEAIRVQRNDAVHPEAGGNLSPNTVRLSFVAFPAAYKKIDALVQWFKANTP